MKRDPWFGLTTKNPAGSEDAMRRDPAGRDSTVVNDKQNHQTPARHREQRIVKEDGENRGIPHDGPRRGHRQGPDAGPAPRRPRELPESRQISPGELSMWSFKRDRGGPNGIPFRNGILRPLAISHGDITLLHHPRHCCTPNHVAAPRPPRSCTRSATRTRPGSRRELSGRSAPAGAGSSSATRRDTTSCSRMRARTGRSRRRARRSARSRPPSRARSAPSTRRRGGTSYRGSSSRTRTSTSTRCTYSGRSTARRPTRRTFPRRSRR